MDVSPSRVELQKRSMLFLGFFPPPRGANLAAASPSQTPSPPAALDLIGHQSPAPSPGRPTALCSRKSQVHPSFPYLRLPTQPKTKAATPFEPQPCRRLRPRAFR